MSILCRFVSQSVRVFVIFLIEREVSPSCSYRSNCFLHIWFVCRVFPFYFIFQLTINNCHIIFETEFVVFRCTQQYTYVFWYFKFIFLPSLKLRLLCMTPHALLLFTTVDRIWLSMVVVGGFYFLIIAFKH